MKDIPFGAITIFLLGVWAFVEGAKFGDSSDVVLGVALWVIAMLIGKKDD